MHHYKRLSLVLSDKAGCDFVGEVCSHGRVILRMGGGVNDTWSQAIGAFRRYVWLRTLFSIQPMVPLPFEYFFWDDKCEKWMQDRTMDTYKFTEYFGNEVFRKRPYLKKEWCLKIIESPLKMEPQENNRFRSPSVASPLHIFWKPEVRGGTCFQGGCRTTDVWMTSTLLTN